jgi:hypothetical protein
MDVDGEFRVIIGITTATEFLSIAQIFTCIPARHCGLQPNAHFSGHTVLCVVRLIHKISKFTPTPLNFATFLTLLKWLYFVLRHEEDCDFKINQDDMNRIHAFFTDGKFSLVPGIHSVLVLI